MSSLEMVEYINSNRTATANVLRHDNFLGKVPQVLGLGSPKFLGTYRHPQNGQTYPCYNFPKREACLMAMAYSYDLQAKVFDRMTALEAAMVDTLRLEPICSLQVPSKERLTRRCGGHPSAVPEIQCASRSAP